MKVYMMNYRIRAFQLSVIVHAAAIILLIVAGNYFVAEKKRLLVVDFTLSDTSEARHGLSVVTGRKKDTWKHETEIVKKREDAAPEPKAQSVRRDVVSVREEPQEASPVAAQVLGVIQTEKTVSQNGGEEYARSASSGHETGKSLASGGMKGVSPGNAGEFRNAGGIDYIMANFSYIRDMIVKKMVYPERAREMGWQGKVKVSFVISSDGSVKDIRILESSGVDVLDRNAVETVKKASPFPRPPAAAQLIIPVSYRLH